MNTLKRKGNFKNFENCLAIVSFNGFGNNIQKYLVFNSWMLFFMLLVYFSIGTMLRGRSVNMTKKNFACTDPSGSQRNATPITFYLSIQQTKCTNETHICRR